MAQMLITRQEVGAEDLPRVCMKCGCRASGLVEHTFQWQPLHYRMVNMFSNVRIYKVMTCRVPICDAHRGHWWGPLIVFGIGFGVCVLAVVFGGLVGGLLTETLGDAAGFVIGIPTALLGVGGILFMIVGTIVASLKTVRITDSTDRGFTFAGLHDDFVSAVEKHRRGGRGGSGSGRKPAKVSADDDDDDEELEVVPASLPNRGRGGVQTRPSGLPPPPPRRSPRNRSVDDDDDEPAPPRRKSGSGWIIGGVMAGVGLVVLLACGGIGAIFFFGVSNTVREKRETVIPPQDVPTALAALRNPASRVQREALQVLAAAQPDPQLKPEVFQVCEPLLNNTSLRAGAAQALAAWADDNDRPLVLRLLNDPQNEIAEAGLNAEIRLRDPQAAPAAARLLGNFFLRGKAVKVLQTLGPVAERDVVKNYFDDDGGIRTEAQRLCQGYGTTDETILAVAIAELRGGKHANGALEWLQKVPVFEARRVEVARAVEPVLYDQNHGLREPAARVLARWATKENTPALLKALTHESGEIRKIVLDPLMQFKEIKAAEALANKLADFFEGQKAFEMLSLFGADAGPYVVKHVNHPDTNGRNRCRDLLRAYKTPNSLIIDQCIEDLNSTDSNRRRAAAEWLASAKVVEDKRDEVARGFNALLMADKDVFYQETLFKSMAPWLSPENIETLSKVAVETEAFSDRRRTPAIQALGKIKDPKAVDALWTIIFFGAKTPKDLEDAGLSLVALGDVALPKMLENVDKEKQTNANVRVVAWKILGAIAPKDKVKDLQALAMKDTQTSQASKLAIAQIMAR